MPIKKTETARERKDTGETAFIIISCINVYRNCDRFSRPCASTGHVAVGPLAEKSVNVFSVIECDNTNRGNLKRWKNRFYARRRSARVSTEFLEVRWISGEDGQKKKIVIENSYLIVTTKKERYSPYSIVTVSDDKTRK